MTQKAYTLSADLSGQARVALVANRIVDCDVFLSQVGEALTMLRPTLDITLYRTGTVTAADDALIQEIAATCDAAICTIGHCGSCTAGTVKDALNFADRSVPSLAPVTELFWEQAEALSHSLGWSEASRIKLPYPIWETGESAQAQVAKSIAPQILAHLERQNARAA